MTNIPLDRNGLEVLEEAECWQLLASTKVGRIGLSTESMPLVLPVTYVVDGRDVVFCSTPGSKLYLAREQAVVAFEADEVDADLRFGWSVCLTGTARVLDGEADVARVRELGLRPWADLQEPSYVAIEGQVVTGRRVRR